MDKNASLKQTLFLLFAFIMAINLVLVVVNGFFVWQLFISPSANAPDSAFDTQLAIEAALTLTAGVPLEATQTPEELETPQEESVTETPAPQATITTQPLHDNGFYTVKAGDDLPRIASLFSLTVDDLRHANGMIGNTILTGQTLFIPPNSDVQPGSYTFSSLTLLQEYNKEYQPPNGATFTLHSNSVQYPSHALEPLAQLQIRSLNNAEIFFQKSIVGEFDVYVAGSLLDDDPFVRAVVNSDADQLFVVYDGTGSPADQLRLISYTTALYAADQTYGEAASPILREGAAMAAAYRSIENPHNFSPLLEICAAIARADRLPSMTGTSFSLLGENLDMINHLSAGCFYEYLLEKMPVGTIGDLYRSANYEEYLQLSPHAVDAAFKTWLLETKPGDESEARDWVDLIEQMQRYYQILLADFSGDRQAQEMLRTLDQSRLALLEKRLEEARFGLTALRMVLE